MASLKVKYLGSLELRNPVVVAASPFTATAKDVLAMEQAGAGAVVLKSLYEEQANQYGSYLEGMGQCGAESAEYAAYYTKSMAEDRYAELVAECKAVATIPIIASVNCTKDGQWVKYAKSIERAGADALQLNIFFLASDSRKSGAQLEKEYLEIVASVTEAVSIPVSVKLPQNFTSIPNLVYELYVRGVKGVTLFNRFVSVDIDIDRCEVVSDRHRYSTPGEIRDHIRLMAVTSGAASYVSYAASTGVHTSEEMIKMLLAGASVVEICSVLYDKGAAAITEMVEQLESYLDGKEIESVSQIIGKLSYRGDSEGCELYERAQFMRYYVLA